HRGRVPRRSRRGRRPRHEDDRDRGAAAEAPLPVPPRRDVLDRGDHRPARPPAAALRVRRAGRAAARGGSLHPSHAALGGSAPPMAYQAFDLHGKTAIVTGGNSGIGLGMAEALAQAGAAVCIWGTNEEKNHTALAHLHAIGGKAVARPCDVRDGAAVDRGCAETVSSLGGVDACFVNAGVSGRGAAASFAEMTTQEWHRVLAVNLDGAFFTLRAA